MSAAQLHLSDSKGSVCPERACCYGFRQLRSCKPLNLGRGAIAQRLREGAFLIEKTTSNCLRKIHDGIVHENQNKYATENVEIGAEQRIL